MTKPTRHHVLPAPCKSCPYRQDVPSGVWAEHEYRKLPAYDGDIPSQIMNGAMGLFMCHQRDNSLCAGWLGCHGPDNLLAMRLHGDQVEPEAFEYKTDVPLFVTGADAAAHGLKDIRTPGRLAERLMQRLEKNGKGKPKNG